MALLIAPLLAVLVLGGGFQAPTDTPSAPATPAPSATEYEVKAAFLYNFTRFVEWPPEALRDGDEPFVIAILGRDPFGSVLDETVAGKTVAGHRIEVRRATRADDVRDAQMVFVCASERATAAAILKALGRPGVLIVGDTEGFAFRGGAINFTLQARKVRFEINPGSAEQAGLKMSSQLLKLATLVGGPKS
jgi:YfiR/HmsC-like